MKSNKFKTCLVCVLVPNTDPSTSSTRPFNLELRLHGLLLQSDSLKGVPKTGSPLIKPIGLLTKRHKLFGTFHSITPRNKLRVVEYAYFSTVANSSGSKSGVSKPAVIVVSKLGEIPVPAEVTKKYSSVVNIATLDSKLEELYDKLRLLLKFGTNYTVDVAEFEFLWEYKSYFEYIKKLEAVANGETIEGKIERPKLIAEIDKISYKNTNGPGLSEYVSGKSDFDYSLEIKLLLINHITRNFKMTNLKTYEQLETLGRINDNVKKELVKTRNALTVVQNMGAEIFTAEVTKNVYEQYLLENDSIKEINKIKSEISNLLAVRTKVNGQYIEKNINEFKLSTSNITKIKKITPQTLPFILQNFLVLAFPNPEDRQSKEVELTKIFKIWYLNTFTSSSLLGDLYDKPVIDSFKEYFDTHKFFDSVTFTQFTDNLSVLEESNPEYFSNNKTQPHPPVGNTLKVDTKENSAKQPDIKK